MDRDYYLCVENKRKFAEFLVQNNCLDIYEWLEASMKEGICVDKKCNICNHNIYASLQDRKKIYLIEQTINFQHSLKEHFLKGFGIN